MGAISIGRLRSEPVLEWAWAGKALGHSDQGIESGDLHLVAPFAGGALVAVIDGLGHGTEAAMAARAAAQILEASAGESVNTLVLKCHNGLRRTRGAVMSLASFDAAKSSITWIGVGNVEGVLLREHAGTGPRRQDISLRGGIVGYQLPPLRAVTLGISRGDMLILATDGIRGGFTVDLPVRKTSQEIADWILGRHSKESDDRLVLVARYLGAKP